MNRQIVGVARALLAPKGSFTTVARNSSHYKPPANWFEPTLNELPVPQGSWQAAYDQQQRKNNIHLIAGASFFLFTMVVLKTSGLVTLNATIPKLPELGEK